MKNSVPRVHDSTVQAVSPSCLYPMGVQVGTTGTEAGVQGQDPGGDTREEDIESGGEERAPGQPSG